MDRKKLGERIRRLRDAKGWTQEQLSSKASIANRALQRIEAGNSKSSPNLKTLEDIASTLGVTVSDLFNAASSPFTAADVFELVEKALQIAQVPGLHRALALTIASGDIRYFDQYCAEVEPPDSQKAEASQINEAVQALLKAAK